MLTFFIFKDPLRFSWPNLKRSCILHLILMHCPNTVDLFLLKSDLEIYTGKPVIKNSLKDWFHGIMLASHKTMLALARDVWHSIHWQDCASVQLKVVGKTCVACQDKHFVTPALCFFGVYTVCSYSFP